MELNKQFHGVIQILSNLIIVVLHEEYKMKNLSALSNQAHSYNIQQIANRGLFSIQTPTITF